MERPTKQQLQNATWWDEFAPEWATMYGVAGDESHPVWYNLEQYQHCWGAQNYLVFAFDGGGGFRLCDISLVCKRPIKSGPEAWVKDLPDRAPAEWQDWKIAPGSWPYWILQRMNAETGRMSYDNPVKGMIRDLWSQVDRPEKQEQQDQIQREHYAKEQREREDLANFLNDYVIPGGPKGNFEACKDYAEIILSKYELVRKGEE